MKHKTISEKLQGRLAVGFITGSHDRAISMTTIRQQYGNRIATLVENGNNRAIKLIKLIDKRRSQRNSSPTIMESIDLEISKLSKELRIPINSESIELTSMMRLAASPNSYNSKNQFQGNLMEGLLLNVTTLASNALSIPSGEYVVWVTNAKNTVLVPTNENVNNEGIMTDRPRQYDVMTPDLVNCWNKVERVIGERDDRGGGRTYENPETGPERIGRPALKKKVEAIGGVRAASEVTDLSPGNISKHVNNRAFEVSGDSARKYMNHLGATPDDIFNYGTVAVNDYGHDDDEDREDNEDREEGGEEQYDR